MQSNNLTYFIRDILYPRTFDYIDRIFPEMDFQRVGFGWASPKNIDGSTPKHPTSRKTVIKEKYPQIVIENGEGEPTDLINLYKSLNNCSTFQACEAMARIVGVSLPEYGNDDKNQWKQYRAEQDKLEASLKRQQKALLESPEGKATLDYILSRGWSVVEVREAGLGYMGKDEAEGLEMSKGVGVYYTLSIPLRSSGWLYGFNVRTIDKETGDKYGKYRFKTGMEKHVFGLSGVKKDEGSVIVVEGELDALKAQIKGIPNVVATGGGNLTDIGAEQIKAKGITTVTFIPDNDKPGANGKEAGKEILRKSIKAANKAGLRCFVAILNDEGCKDLDDYLRVHDVEELKAVLESTVLASLYRVNERLDTFTMEKGRTATASDFLSLEDDVIEIANDSPRETERRAVLSEYAHRFNKAGFEDTILADAERARKQANQKRQKAETEKAAKEILSLTEEGDTKAALRMMEKASRNLANIDRHDKYSALLAIPNEMDIRARMRKKQDALETPYIFRKSTNGDKEQFTIPSGAITFICAPTSHGKSTFLQNIALQLSRGKETGDTLYFTFEEDGDSVLIQMLNKYINQTISTNNLKHITTLWRTGSEKGIYEEYRVLYHEKEKAFLDELINSGKLRIFYEDYDSTELIEAIESYSTRNKVKAVFIDYIQLLSKNGCRKQRTEELKEICQDLKNLAVKTQIPIVVAAQLNRETKSPLDLHSQNIAEAADLERIANKIVCIWNSAFKERGERSKDLVSWESLTGITLGQEGSIYAKMVKNRGGIVGLDAVLNFTGNTGVIEPNDQRGTMAAPTEPEPDEMTLPKRGRKARQLKEDKQETLPPERNELPF